MNTSRPLPLNFPKLFVSEKLVHSQTWLIPLILASFVGLVILYRLFLHPLRNVPGPFPAKLTELWRTRRYALGNWHNDILDLHERYGPVVRISPNEVSFVDKEALTKVYGHATGTRKTSWYDVWGQPGASTSLFAATDVKEHAFLRKRIATAYTMSTILSLESLIENVNRAVWKTLDSAADQGKVVDMQKWASYFAFDVVGTVGIGGPIGFVEKGGDVSDIMFSIHNMFYVSSIMGYIPGQLWWFRNALSTFITNLCGAKAAQAGAVFQNWLIQQCQGRMSAPRTKDRRSDMLDHLISMKEPDGSSVQLPGVLIEAGNLIGAGADTTAAGIGAVLGQLVNHPEDYSRVQAEIDAALSSKEGIAVKALDFKTAESLPFLVACVKEALRLCPSILWQLPRHTPSTGINIAGYEIPAGTTVSMSPIAQNRCKEIFGDDANEWRPQRYLVGQNGVTQEYVKEIERYNVTFGFGSRTCIGKHLAMVEILRFVGQFVQRYDVEAVNSQQPFKRRSQWFVLNEDFNLRLKRRGAGVKSEF